MSLTIEDVEAKLTRLVADLPDRAEDLAAWLAVQGCQGHPGNTYACPMAVLFRRTFGDLTVVVTADSAMVRVEPHRWARVPLPLAASRFVFAFDRGLFPELVVKRSGT